MSSVLPASLYALLGLPTPFNGSVLEIRRAYRRAALLYHPDRNHPSSAKSEHGGCGGSSVVPFHVLHRAASVLLDPQGKVQYDAWLQSGGDTSSRVKRVDVGDERNFVVVGKLPWEQWQRSTDRADDTLQRRLHEALHYNDKALQHLRRASGGGTTVDLDAGGVLSSSHIETLFTHTVHVGEDCESQYEPINKLATTLNILDILNQGGSGEWRDDVVDAAGWEHELNIVIAELLGERCRAVPSTDASSLNRESSSESEQGGAAPNWFDSLEVFLPSLDNGTSADYEGLPNNTFDPDMWARPSVALVPCKLECRCSGVYTVDLPFLHLVLADVSKYSPSATQSVLRRQVLLLLLALASGASKQPQVSTIISHLTSMSLDVKGGEEAVGPTDTPTVTLADLTDSLYNCLCDYVALQASVSREEIGEMMRLRPRRQFHHNILVATHFSRDKEGASSPPALVAMRSERCSTCSLVMGLWGVPHVVVATSRDAEGNAKGLHQHEGATPCDERVFDSLFPRGM